MSVLPLWAYAAILVASLLLSLVLTPLAITLATRQGILDHPGPAKAHNKAVPYLGGAAIVMSFAVVILLAAAVDPSASGMGELAAFMGLAMLLSLVGLADDVFGGISPWLRLAIEAGAGVAVWLLGDSAHVAGVPDWGNAVIGVVWVVGVTNAFNLLDNMDGLSAGVAAVAAGSIFAIACLQHRYLVAALAIALAGCAAGFLRHNFHPARIYMGDAGSLFLGFVVAVLCLKLREDAPTRVPIAVILAVPGVALFDTALVVVSRLRHGRNPMQGGQDHTSHRLVRLGCSVRQAVGLIYLASAVLGGAAIGMAYLGHVVRIAGVVGLGALGLVAALILGRVRVYEPRERSVERVAAVPAQPPTSDLADL
jgi:UDP-GlcNAc:undecaprenyl-phosphate GlcNAc-1-phosphate transferase